MLAHGMVTTRRVRVPDQGLTTFRLFVLRTPHGAVRQWREAPHPAAAAARGLGAPARETVQLPLTRGVHR